MKRVVVIGFYGATKDKAAKGPERWARWRPTLSLLQHEDFLVDRLELLVAPREVENSQHLIEDMQCVSPETEIVVRDFQLKNFWDFEEVYGALHDFMSNYEWRTEEEEYLFHITTGSHVTQICSFLLTESRHFPGRLLQSAPPARSRGMAYGLYHIVDLDLSRYDRLAARFHKETTDHLSFLKDGIQTRNQPFNQLMERLETVALRTSDPILLTGPTGAGKSALARRIFELKQGRNLVEGDFVEVNCATLRGSNALSTLFGHKKGAFTGAQQERRGLLRKADGGIIFLDEIGELGLDEQAMLLHAIEEKRFMPLGSDREVSSSFQLLCGTNRNLQQDVSEGRFRRDLLARINLWVFQMPGLKDRREDIAPNLDFELDRFAGRTGSRVDFNSEARQEFLHFAESEKSTWSGNFRDLNGAVTRLGTLASGGRITVNDVQEEAKRLRGSWVEESQTNDLDLPPHLAHRPELQQLDPFERCQLVYTLDMCRQSASLSEAGRTLFAHSREKRKSVNDADRVRKYLLRFGIEWADASSSGEGLDLL